MPTNPGGDAPTRRRLSQLTGMDTTEAANPVRSRGAPDQCFSDVVPQRRRTQPSGLLPQSPTPGFSTALGLARTATSLYSRWPVRPAQPFPGPIRRAAPVDPHARPCACALDVGIDPVPPQSTGYGDLAPLPHPSPIRREQHRKLETSTEVITRFTGRPRPIPDDGSTCCMTRS
jgi:hypothetical protein